MRVDDAKEKLRCTCGREFKSYGGLTTHASKKHGLSIEEMYVMFRLGGVKPSCAQFGCLNVPYFKGPSRGFCERCSKHRGKWQEGLTCETDVRINARGKAISRAQLAGKHWSYDQSLRTAVAQKISTARALRPKIIRPIKYAGLSKGIGWSKGLSRETDPRLAAMGDALRGRTTWSKGLSKYTDVRLRRSSSSRRLNNDEVLARIEQRSNDFALISSVDEYETYQGKLTFKCVRCENLQEKSIQSLDHGSRCHVCFPYGFTSKYQDEIRDFIRSLGLVTEQTRKLISPYEIDVYVPEKRVGIEMNGLYWHSEATGKRADAHQLKSDACSQIGVRLLHVFEDEWRDRRPIVESMIKHALGMTDVRINARDCAVGSCTAIETSEFFRNSHLDGNTSSKIAFCLRLDKQIVSCLSLRNPFITNNGGSTIELARFASLPNVSVVGALSRLLSHAMKWARDNGHRSIITYADQRLGQISSYDKVGFRRVDDTGLRFWWTDYNQRYNRFKFRASGDKTQETVATEAGVTRIWGCRNSKFVMDL